MRIPHAVRETRCFPLLLLAIAQVGCDGCKKSDPASVDAGGAATTAALAVDAGEQAIQTMPYLNYVPVKPEHKGKSGTTFYDKARAELGYNLYTTRGQPASARLVDMQGELVHQWSTQEAQPDPAVVPRLQPYMIGWYFARMTPKGDLFTMVSHSALLKVDWNSKVIWKVALPVHHDIVEADNGDIYTMTEAVRQVDSGGKKRVILDEGVAILSSEGAVKKRISFYDALSRTPDLAPKLQHAMDVRFRPLEEQGLEKLIAEAAKDPRAVAAPPPGAGVKVDGGGPKDPESVFLARQARARATPGALEELNTIMRTGKSRGDVSDMALLESIPGIPSDIFHSNAVLPLKKHKSGVWKDGDILVSIRHFDLVAVLDPEQGRFTWWWGPGVIEGQHQPSVTPDGNILVFDNGDRRKNSRIVEVNPATKKVTWTYEGKPPTSFFSSKEGGCQLLPKGNVLVADGGSGRAFETTRGGDIVWEYFVPAMGDEWGGTRQGIYRMERYAPAVVEPLRARP